MEHRLTLQYSTSPERILDELALPSPDGVAIWREAVGQVVGGLRSLHPTLAFDAEPFEGRRQKAPILHLRFGWCDAEVAYGIVSDMLRLQRAICPDAGEYPSVLRAMTLPELALVRRATRVMVRDPFTAFVASSEILRLAQRITNSCLLCTVRTVPERTKFPWTEVLRLRSDMFQCQQEYGLGDLPAWVLIHEAAHVIARIEETPRRMSGAKPVDEHGPEYVRSLRQLMELVEREGAIDMIEAMTGSGGRTLGPPEGSEAERQTLPQGWMGMVESGLASATWCSLEDVDGVSGHDLWIARLLGPELAKGYLVGTAPTPPAVPSTLGG